MKHQIYLRGKNLSGKFQLKCLKKYPISDIDKPENEIHISTQQMTQESVWKTFLWRSGCPNFHPSQTKLRKLVYLISSSFVWFVKGGN